MTVVATVRMSPTAERYAEMPESLGGCSEPCARPA
jgi:hypothetical protein